MWRCIAITCVSVFAACNNQKNTTDTAPAPSHVASTGDTTASQKAPSPPPSQTETRRTTSSHRSEAVIPAPVSRKDIVAVSLLSPRSLSMKLRTKGGGIKVFKPLLEGDRRARFEVAAYLVANVLGLPGVPPAVIASLPLSLLQGRLAKDNRGVAERLAEEALLDDRKWLAGAQIDWVADLDPAGIEKHGGLKTLKRWLHPARPKDEYEPMLASSLSNTVVFDYLIGNWDRFSGGNLFINRAADRLILLDHNGSFAKWAGTREKRMNALLENTQRFSKSFIDRIRRLKPEEIEQALALDPSHPHRPLLDKNQISLIMKRRDELIAHVESLIKQKGTENIIVFE